MAVTAAEVLAVLKRIRGPDLESNIVDLGLVSEVLVTPSKDAGDRVSFAISVAPDRADELEPLRQAAEKVVAELPGVTSAIVVLTAERKPGAPTRAQRPPESPRVAAARSAGGGAPAAAHSHAHPPAQQPAAAPGAARKAGAVPGIKHLIAVASGKGGVGKSTVAVNLALGFQAIGLRAGIMDADIYGPSQPRLLGMSGRPKVSAGNRLEPMRAHGLEAMSMGLLVDEATPVIWRGPMVVSALNQMLREVEWGSTGDKGGEPLDILVIDMPPGTGDIQLSIAQQVPLAGAVIVSTPQDLALIDARKGLNMFKKVDVPVLGIIENMSYFLCPKCGERSDIFSHGGAEHEAEALGLPFLGAIPLHMEIRSSSDAGQPIVASVPASPNAKLFRDIAVTVWTLLGSAKAGLAAPPELSVSPGRDALKVAFGPAGGKTYTLPAEMLRVMSPSAEVQGHSPSQRVTVGGKRNVKIKELRPIGNYAVRIAFDDGHDTGLFSWTYLDELGREQATRWATYLAELEAKGLDRG